MRCSRCGNDNPAENRFCGMCGATLLTPIVPPGTVVPETQTQRAASAGTAIPSAVIPSPVVTAPPRPQETARAQEVPRPSPPPPREPSVSGPSFLGLNDPPPRTRASLHVDPHHAGSSANLDYLLDDEEHPKRGGAGRALFVIALLAIVVGFGYLRFRNNGFQWSKSDNKPSAPEQTPADPNANPPGASAPTTTPEQTPSPTQPTVKATQPAPANTGAEANLPAAAPSTAAPAKGEDPNAAPDNSGDNGDDNAPEENSQPAAPAKAAKVEAPKPTLTKPAAAKPSPVAKPARTTDTVAEAQRYLYGKGAPQNCDRGLQLLKPEANKANPKAMIEMGALYSAGLCTPRDLPTAYRWFAQALRKDPENQAVQTDLQKLWGEMTQPERQLAIKLSQ